ncbi:class II fructose-bisphosphate aldolase [Patescibacteria group bacterium]
MLSAQEILTKAQDKGYALGAFNAGNLELIKAVAKAAEGQQAPVIVEASAGETSHFGRDNFLKLAENFCREFNLELLTNFDHGPGLQECQEAIEAGYNLVHFDGSALPYEENVKITRLLVDQAHQKGVLVEGEIDKIIGKSSPHLGEEAKSFQDSAAYTDVERAIDFVEKTGVDILAVSVGNLHGIYSSPPRLDLNRLGVIAQKLSCFLSLHGGSGLLDEDIQGALKIGRVVKINVNTELRIAFRETLENVLKGSEEVAIYKIMTPVIAAVQKVVEDKIELFGSANKVTSHKVLE